jgi:hypothetical protein
MVRAVADAAIGRYGIESGVTAHVVIGVDAGISPWRRNYLRDATRHDKRAGAVAVIHK